LKVAITTSDFKGLDDEVWKEFARCPTVTIVEVDREKGVYRLVEISENKAARFKSRPGPFHFFLVNYWVIASMV
jgi:predicted Fe-Mo cluster-binding NifX family protein